VKQYDPRRVVHLPFLHSEYNGPHYWEWLLRVGMVSRPGTGAKTASAMQTPELAVDYRVYGSQRIVNSIPSSFFYNNLASEKPAGEKRLGCDPGDDQHLISFAFLQGR
jgi:hypothetical protein